jgi:hypothetical protein
MEDPRGCGRQARSEGSNPDGKGEHGVGSSSGLDFVCMDFYSMENSIFSRTKPQISQMNTDRGCRKTPNEPVFTFS